jgi:hypothetical protein
MTARKTGKNKPKVEELELNRETIQDLTDDETEAAEGGQVYRSLPQCQSRRCASVKCTREHYQCGRTEASPQACPESIECIIIL